METADEVEQLAGECAIIRRAVALAGWVGPEGKALTRAGVLRKPAVPAACAAIGVRVPERFRSAADVPGLHRPWTAALALGLLEVAHDRAAAGRELEGWPGEADSAGRWLDALRAVCGDISGGAADASLGLLVLALAVLRSLSAGVGLSSREVTDAAQAIADERGLGLMQVHVVGGMSALSRGFLADQVESLLGLLAEFGAVTAGKKPAVTPLGAWAMERLEADLPCAVDPDAEAAEAITAVAMAAAADRWYIAQGWLRVRKPADAVRELLKAADLLPAWLRDAAATMGAMTGEDGLPGWHAIAGNAPAWPNSARLARAELYNWGQGPEPSPEERGWLGAEAAAAAILARGEARRGRRAVAPTRRCAASVTPSRPVPASQSGTSTTWVPAGSTRLPARAHPALPRAKPSPVVCPSAEITPSSTGTRTNSPARSLSTWPWSTPRSRTDPRVLSGAVAAQVLQEAGQVLFLEVRQTGRPGLEAPELCVGDRPAYGRDYRLPGVVVIGANVD